MCFFYKKKHRAGGGNTTPLMALLGHPGNLPNENLQGSLVTPVLGHTIY